MPRKGAKAPGPGVGVSDSSVTVVSGSIRTPDESDALDVKLSIWATEVTLRADGTELGNWELSDVAVRAIDSTSFEFIAEGDHLIFKPDDPVAFGASSLVADRAGGKNRKNRKGRKAKRTKPEPGPTYDAQDRSAPTDDRRGKRRTGKEPAAPKASRRDRKAAERAAAELAEAQGIGVEGPAVDDVGPSINVAEQVEAAMKRHSTVRAAPVPTPIGEVRSPGTGIGGTTVTGAAAAESTVAPDAVAPTITPNRTAMADAASVTDNGITDSTVTDSTVTDSTVTDSTVTDSTVTDSTVADRGVEVAPVERPPREPRRKRSRRKSHDEPAVAEAAVDDLEESDAGTSNRMWLRALDVARRYDFLGLDRVPVNEALRGQDHQHTWDHRVAPASGPGKHICTICGEIRR